MDIIKPFLPALQREGQEVFEGFVKHALDRDWAKIDKLMYAKMTQAERDELDRQVLEGVRAAAISRVNRIKLYKDIAFKVLLRLLLGFI